MIVTWVTFDDVGDSYVMYRETEHHKHSRVLANVTHFGGGFIKLSRYIHRATIGELESGKEYVYYVGSRHGWSNEFTFQALTERPEGGYKFAVYGDMGAVNSRSLGELQNQVREDNIDMILHVGDFAYNLDLLDGRVGDQFFNKIESVAAKVPYMTCPGNHEFPNNFTHYINRFTMPNSEHNLFYSFDLDKVHFVFITTEIYYNTFLSPNDKLNIDDVQHQQLQTQWNWLVNDLEKANKNRYNVPWIVVLGHRPMYCSTDSAIAECRYKDVRVRVGINGEFELEKLLFENGVDLEVFGHEHNYERMYPIYDEIVFKNTKDPYYDPPAPVQVITGSAGCIETPRKFTKEKLEFDAHRSTDYGFSVMQVFNDTHLQWQQIRAHDGGVEDSFMLIKTTHEPYGKNGLKRLYKQGTLFNRPKMAWEQRKFTFLNSTLSL
ncbi:unnamed protein product [Bursaphelenchus okinawaensis]|uniref:Purple acid phosphatase n=1 Tax=Bursaphelenchus okinawaensis TaxID=465554 RepID=A0A811L1D3_9BILA|nr:unnamed protein product [Bursaphelenchus okinawaensis]CAG9114438.1 unnamed protein product [Bursaphelenchus okinawaensis]